MLVSTKGRYALRILVELSKHPPGEFVPAGTIAEAQEISEKYLETIIAILLKAKFIDGARGKNGGYCLNRPSSRYSVGEILRLTERTLAPVSCLDCNSQSATCPRLATCPTRPMWEKLDMLITTYLDNVTLDDLRSR